MTPAPQPKVTLGMDRPPMHDDGRLRLGNATRGGLVAAEVVLLESRFARARMLFGRRLGPKAAVVVPQPGVLHSIGSPQPVRVACLDADSRVTAVLDLPRWQHLSPPAGTANALLLHRENPAELNPGDKVEWLQSQPRLEERSEWLVDGQPPEAWD